MRITHFERIPLPNCLLAFFEISIYTPGKQKPIPAYYMLAARRYNVAVRPYG
jgi:hypothetical protein